MKSRGNHRDLEEKATNKTRNLIPGTLIYRGRIKQGFSIDLHYYDESELIERKFETALAFESFDIDKNSFRGKVKWINVTGLWNIEEIKSIGKYLEIPPLLLEQILNISNHSINRSGEGYLFNSIQMVYSENGAIKNEYISIFKNREVLVTFQEKPGDIFDDIRLRINQDKGLVRKASLDYLYFCLLDALGDNYLSVTEKLQPRIEEIEDRIIRGNKIKIHVIHELRKILTILDFSSEPIGNFIHMLNAKKTLLDMPDETYLESLDIHIKEAIDGIELQKDTVDNLFENYILNNSNNMNQIMTVLTIFSAIFIPLSFLAGVFGMNFDYLPGLENKMGFFYFLIGCVVTAGGMLAFFKIKKWF